MAQKEKMHVLTSIRFIFAMLIVLGHFLGPSQHIPPVFYRFIENGFIGVSLFFVLSGFILAYNYRLIPAGQEEKRFWVGRLARIYPLYLAAFLLSLPIHIDPINRTASFSWFSTGAYAVGELFMLQSWFPKIDLMVNIPAWYISAQVFCYLLFPLATRRLARVKDHHLLPLAGILWLISLIVPAIFLLLTRTGALDSSFQDTLVYFIIYNPLLNLPQFLIGVIVGQIYSRGLRIPWVSDHPNSTSLVLSLLFFAALALFNLEPYYPAINNGALAPLLALLIFALANSRGAIIDLFSQRWLILLGEISYSIYLLQVPVNGYLDVFINHRLQTSDYYPKEMILFLVFLVGIAALSHSFFEKPLARWMMQRYSRRTSTASVQPRQAD